MKLSECYLGRVVQLKILTYEDAISRGGFGHVLGFEIVKEDDSKRLMVRYRPPLRWYGDSTCNYALPEDLKPLED